METFIGYCYLGGEILVACSLCYLTSRLFRHINPLTLVILIIIGAAALHIGLALMSEPPKNSIQEQRGWHQEDCQDAKAHFWSDDCVEWREKT